MVQQTEEINFIIECLHAKNQSPYSFHLDLHTVFSFIAFNNIYIVNNKWLLNDLVKKTCKVLQNQNKN